MNNFYFLNQKIVIVEKKAVLNKVISDVELDPVDLLKGAKLVNEPKKIEITLAESSGDFFPDMFSTPVTLMSSKMKACFDNLGIKNIDFYPAILIDTKNSKKIEGYWLVNVLGRFQCLDEENSDTSLDPLGYLEFESFCIDETKILGAEVFRLNENGRMIIIGERIYRALMELDLKGVVIKNTKEFDGYGI